MNHPAFLPRQSGCVASCVIFGRRSLQNELLARLIEEHRSIPCIIAEYTATDFSCHHPNALALLDAGAVAESALEGQVGELQAWVSVIAIFNASKQQAIDRLLRWPKVKGLFYENTGEEQFLRGIQALCMNEHWLPRKAMGEYLEQTRSTQHCLTVTDVTLTPKETQILRAMISGAKNTDIAQVLHLSPHTVKTHIYNLFRKIKAGNRVQAVSWAMLNLERKS